jgi:hypothetical protein
VGGRQEIFTNAKMVQKVSDFIVKNGLKASMNSAEFVQVVQIIDTPVVAKAEPVTVKTDTLTARTDILTPKTDVLTAKTDTVVSRVPPIWIHGGMKNPHLHYDGKIYELNEAQWDQFVKSTVDEFSSKLVQAKSISFETFMNVSEILKEAT